METAEYTIKNYWSISQKINNFELNLKTKEVDAEERHALHLELDSLYEEMEQVAAQANETVLPLFVKMREQFISLYGNIEDFFEKYSVSHIAKEALRLSLLLTSGQWTKAALLSERLKSHIAGFMSERLPSLQNRKILALAEKLSAQAEEAPSQGERTKLSCLHLASLLKTLLDENLEKTRAFLYPDEAELAIELYEIAELYGQSLDNKAWHKLKALLYRLPGLQANQFIGEERSSQEKANLLLAAAEEITNGSEIAVGPESRSEDWRFSGTLV